MTQIIKDTEEDLIRTAISIREHLEKSIYSLKDVDLPPTGMANRWHIQRYHYAVNRLLYLSHPKDYDKLLHVIPDKDGFQEIRALLRAFINRDITDLLYLPGRVITAFSELWAEYEKVSPEVNWNIAIERRILDSLSTLLLYDICEIPEDVRNKFSDKDKQFLNFCAGFSSTQRENSDFSYLDEVKTLQIGTTKEKMLDLLTTRFSDDENIMLEGLHLDEVGYYS